MKRTSTVVIVFLALMAASSVLAVDYDPACLKQCQKEYRACRAAGHPMDACLADFDGCKMGCVVENPDVDGDGILNGVDNCPYKANAGQEDYDCDGTGNVCDGSDNPALRNCQQSLVGSDIVDNKFFCPGMPPRYIRTTIEYVYNNQCEAKRCVGPKPYQEQWLPRSFTSTEPGYSDCPVYWLTGNGSDYECQAGDPDWDIEWPCLF